MLRMQRCDRPFIVPSLVLIAFHSVVNFTLTQLVVQSVKLSNYDDRCFSVSGPIVWNNLLPVAYYRRNPALSIRILNVIFK